MAFDTPINSNDQSFDRVLGAGLPVLALFSAGAPSTPLEDSLKQIAKSDAGTLLVTKIRADENPQLVKRFAIRAPTVLTFKEGSEYSRGEMPDAAQVSAHAAYLMGRAPKPAAAPTNDAGATSADASAQAGKPLHVTDGSFAQDVLQSPLPVLVDFWADWCRPCHMVAPTLEKLAKEYAGRVRIAKLDVDRNPHTQAQYQVQGIPTLLSIKNGKVVDRIVGAAPEPQIRANLEKLLRSN